MRILILTNHQTGLYKFRKELLQALKENGNEIIISVPEGDFTEELTALGTKILINKKLDRRGTNPLNDLKLLKYYKKLLIRLEPDVVLTYTIKPNVYGGYLCGKLRIPYISNITGLGTSIENKRLLQTVILKMYKVGLKNAKKIFFQNISNLNFMLKHKVVLKEKTDVLPGSGVNTEEYGYIPFPVSENPVIFSTIGRIMKDKGIDEILEAAQIIKKTHHNIVFRLIGDYEDNYKDRIENLQKKGFIEYIPFQKNVKPYIAESHALIHASYHEGMSNVLLEAASCGRPLIATDVPGCIEIYEPNVTGIGFKPSNTESLVNAVEKFLDLSRERKAQMGIAGREKIIREFSRNIVIKKYMEIIIESVNPK